MSVTRDILKDPKNMSTNARNCAILLCECWFPSKHFNSFYMNWNMSVIRDILKDPKDMSTNGP